MQDKKDIRDQAYLSGEDLKQLNFIHETKEYVFRKYYRSGLRSHIFEVLLAKDVKKETRGELVDGIRVFPRAKPEKMFRILRQRFKNCDAVFLEIKKYNLLLKWLGTELIATSEEFIVDYTGMGETQIVLCGLQEYVDGDIIDPWRLFDKDCLKDLFKTRGYDKTQVQNHLKILQGSIFSFVSRIRKMITHTGVIPDLAGNGNLIVTPEGRLKLVDINNIVQFNMDDTILIDDKGYPSCDVSVEVLSILEQMVMNKNDQANDPLYRLFLSPERKKMVKMLERSFYKRL
ncbi:MAG: hypothetical protein L3J69_06275 [Desulfobacula sp.]|nr:hypothetical protein [Desulfobacula sp.]